MLETFVHVLASASRNSYDAVGRLINTVDQAGNYRRTEYIDLPDSSTTKYYAGGPGVSETLLSTTVSDAAGRQVSSTDALGHQTIYVYDAANRQTEVWSPAVDGVVAKSFTGYDALGRRVCSTNQEGQVTSFGYDGLGRLTSVTNALSQVTAYRYDEAGNLLWQVDANNHTTRFEYDDLGRRTARILPGGQTERFAYDLWDEANRRILHRDMHTNFQNEVTTLDYDVAGRLVKKLHGSAVVTYTYTPSGQRQTMTDASGTTTYVYGRLLANGTPAYDVDRLLAKQQPQCGTILYDYDNRGNLAKIDATRSGTLGYNSSSYRYEISLGAADSSRSLLTYAYDTQNRLWQVRQGSGGTLVAGYGYFDNGNLQTVSYPAIVGGVVVHSYAYNEVNGLTVASITANGLAVASFNYNPNEPGRKLGAAGERRAVRESIGSVVRSVNYDYDALYRLTKEDLVRDDSGYGARSITPPTMRWAIA